MCYSVTSMLRSRNLDVSVVLPFEDDEDIIGTAVQCVAAELEALGLRFEILAVDQDSGDNSHAVLALVRSRHALLRHALQIRHARARDRGYAHGAQHARGRVLWLLEPRAATAELTGFGDAYQRVNRGERELVVHGDRFAVAHRVRAGAVIAGLRGAGIRFHHRLVRRARAHGLAVAASLPAAARAPRPLERLMAALSHGFIF